MANLVNKAKFRIIGSITSPSADRGYYAGPAEALVFELEDSTGVQSVTWETYDPSDPSSPLASFEAPSFSIGGVGPKLITNVPPFSTFATTPNPALPLSNSWFLRCTAIVAGVAHIFVRVISTNTGAISRKPIPGETTENSSRGWADDIAAFIEGIGGYYTSIGSGSERGYVAYQASSDAAGARFTGKKARGTPGAPANLSAGDAIDQLVARPYVSGSFLDAGSLSFYSLLGGAAANCQFTLALHDGVALQQVSNTIVRRVVTTDATPTTVLTLPMAHADSIMSLAVRWRGIDGAHKMVFRESTFVFRRIDTAGPTQLGTTQDVFPASIDDVACGTPGFAVSGNNILLQVTGKAATTYGWDVEATWRELF